MEGHPMSDLQSAPLEPAPKAEAKYPWDNWTPEQHEQAKKLVYTLHGVRLYRSAGGGGFGGKEFRDVSDDMAAGGDLNPDQALLLGRYAQHLNGEENISSGPLRDDKPTSGAVDFWGTPAEKKEAMRRRSGDVIAHSGERIFDGLVTKHKIMEPGTSPLDPSLPDEPPKGQEWRKYLERTANGG